MSELCESDERKSGLPATFDSPWRGLSYHVKRLASELLLMLGLLHSTDSSGDSPLSKRFKLSRIFGATPDGPLIPLPGLNRGNREGNIDRGADACSRRGPGGDAVT